MNASRETHNYFWTRTYVHFYVDAAGTPISTNVAIIKVYLNPVGIYNEKG